MHHIILYCIVLYIHIGRIHIYIFLNFARYMTDRVILENNITQLEHNRDLMPSCKKDGITLYSSQTMNENSATTLSQMGDLDVIK